MVVVMVVVLVFFFKLDGLELSQVILLVFLLLHFKHLYCLLSILCA